jgi:hypothetical protein
VTDEHLTIAGPWTCALHKTHGQAKPLRGAVHHVWPRGAGGPDEAANRITVCETGHANLHHLMWQLLNGHADRPARDAGGAVVRAARRGRVDGCRGSLGPTAFMA